VRVIGVTGGIASGKSLVSEELAKRGAAIINADLIGHESYRRGATAYQPLIEAFGSEIVGADGEIDRKALGARVFGDAEARERLQAIVWPVMRRMMEGRLDGLRSNGVPVAVLEAALLIEADWLPLVDEVWLVTTTRETALARLAERNGLTTEQAEARLAAQLSDDERRPHADVIIPNDGSIDALRQRVDAAWSELQSRAEATA
jgi:dephospho-CoA kinase